MELIYEYSKLAPVLHWPSYVAFGVLIIALVCVIYGRYFKRDVLFVLGSVALVFSTLYVGVQLSFVYQQTGYFKLHNQKLERGEKLIASGTFDILSKDRTTETVKIGDNSFINYLPTRTSANFGCWKQFFEYEKKIKVGDDLRIEYMVYPYTHPKKRDDGTIVKDRYCILKVEKRID